MDVSKSICNREHKFVPEMKEECQVFCVKLILWSIVAQKGTNILIFYIFESGAESGTECSAEYGAKQYFIVITKIKKHNQLYFGTLVLASCCQCGNNA